jgi:hypothetical protein
MNSLLSELLQWMQNNNYRRASFDRIIGIVPSASTYDQLYQLINSNPMTFRTAIIKGGLPGLALLDDVDLSALLESTREEPEAVPMMHPTSPPPVESTSKTPLVTPALIDFEIESTYYRNLGSALKVPDSPAGNVTLCVLILRNGFVIVGKSACVHRENFNEEVGQRLAREDAIRQIGPFMGWREADKRLAY